MQLQFFSTENGTFQDFSEGRRHGKDIFPTSHGKLDFPSWIKMDYILRSSAGDMESRGEKCESEATELFEEPGREPRR
jgi:hypothetical protein